MIEHNNPAEATEIAVDRDRLREQLFKAVHPLTSKWGWFPAEKHAGDIADAALAVVQPVLERQAAALDAALGGESRARLECNELHEEISLLKRELANAQQAYNRTFDRMATIENEEQGR